MKYIGTLSSILLICCGIPELIRGIYSGYVGINIFSILIWLLGEIFGLIYVIHRKDKPLMLNYGFNTLLVGFLLYIKVFGNG